MAMAVVTNNVHPVIFVAAPPQNTTYKNCTTTNVQWCMHTQNAAAATWGNLSRGPRCPHKRTAEELSLCLLACAPARGGYREAGCRLLNQRQVVLQQRLGPRRRHLVTGSVRGRGLPIAGLAR